jgi:hypothetical protein
MLSFHKKAVSIMIGYVLLITFAIIIGGVVYVWMSSYVPTETIECPDGVSIFIKDVECKNIGGEYQLALNLSNNGRFAIDGYYLKVSNNPDIKIGNVPVTTVLSGAQEASGIIFFQTKQLEPGAEAGKSVFKLKGEAFLVEVTPIRYEVIENKNKLAICGASKASETISCK